MPQVSEMIGIPCFMETVNFQSLGEQDLLGSSFPRRLVITRGSSITPDKLALLQSSPHHTALRLRTARLLRGWGKRNRENFLWESRKTLDCMSGDLGSDPVCALSGSDLEQEFFLYIHCPFSQLPFKNLIYSHYYKSISDVLWYLKSFQIPCSFSHQEVKSCFSLPWIRASFVTCSDQ